LPQPAGPASSTKSSAGEARADRVGGCRGARRRAGPDSRDRDRDMNSFEFSQS
jgi:hypothetical protein